MLSENRTVFMLKTKKNLFLLLAFLPLLAGAQDLETLKTLHRNWRAGAAAGVNYLSMELKKDFSQASMDMNSLPDLSYSFFFYKRFKKHMEIGLELEKNMFNGYKNHSGNVPWLVYDPSFNTGGRTFLPRAIYYNTDIWSFFFNFNYSFLNIYSYKHNFLNLNSYLKVGLGFSAIRVEMGYKNQQDYFDSNMGFFPLYEKGQGGHKGIDSYGTFHAGAGINYFISDRFSISAEALFLFVSCDYLDGVHNMTATLLDNGSVQLDRVGVVGTVGELKLSVSYYFNLYKKTLRSSTIWNEKKEEFKNEFYFDKKHNRFK